MSGSLLTAQAQDAPQVISHWTFARPMIQQLDIQLENHANLQYDSPVKVIIARSSIRTRVLARDLLASGISDPSDVGKAMVFYGTMIFEHLDELDNLFKNLPDVPAMERDDVVPTEHQRRMYLLLKPAMERFAQNPISKLRLNVLYPGQVRNRVSLAFAPLADALEAANLPAIRNVWLPASQSEISDAQLDMIATRFDALKIDTSKLPVKEILNQVRPAMQIQEYKPQVYQSCKLMRQIVNILQIVQKHPTAFILARPLIIEQFEVGLANYQNPQRRALGTGQLNMVVAFEDVIIRLDQLLDQLQDTLVYEQLLAKTIESGDSGRIEPMHRWLHDVLDNWYHIRRLSHSVDRAFVPSDDILNGRWAKIQKELAKITQGMLENLPLALSPQHEQWLDECDTTRGLFEDIMQLPMLITHRSQGLFAPLKTQAQDLLGLTNARAGSTVIASHARLISLSRQWRDADNLMRYQPRGILADDGQAIKDRIITDVKNWVQRWQAEEPNEPQAMRASLQTALDTVQSAQRLNEVIFASQDGLYHRMGIVDLDQATCDEMLARIPVHSKEIIRLFTDGSNPQDMKLNLQRVHDDLSYLVALGRVTAMYRDYTPTNLNAPASMILSRLIWQPASDEFDPQLTRLCTALCLTARQWTFERKQDDPKHRRELMNQMRDLGNKINARLDELK
ncbi:MAG: hypothetical protein ACF8OB_07115 [Phycisphaeraceae bacterium JB051]